MNEEEEENIFGVKKDLFAGVETIQTEKDSNNLSPGIKVNNIRQLRKSSSADLKKDIRDQKMEAGPTWSTINDTESSDPKLIKNKAQNLTNTKESMNNNPTETDCNSSTIGDVTSINNDLNLKKTMTLQEQN